VQEATVTLSGGCTRRTAQAALAAAAFALLLGGCETDSFFDPSRTGRFEYEPTTVPVLDRIAVIEQKEEMWSRATPVMPEDLIPGELSYHLSPGDQVTVGVFELFRAGEWAISSRRIDASGKLRVQGVGDVHVAGLTPQQLEERIVQALAERVMVNAQVDVVVEQGGGMRYTIYGFLGQPGVFTLQQADLRLIDALSLTGGVPITTERIYVIREVALSEEVKPLSERRPENGAPEVPATMPTEPPVDIEDLIEQLEPPPGPRPQISPGMMQQEPPPIDIDDLEPTTAPEQPPATEPESLEPAETQPTTMPEAPRPIDELEPATVPAPPPVDIDVLEPVRAPAQPPIDVDELRKGAAAGEQANGDSYIYVEERGEWVRVRPQDGDVAVPGPTGAAGAPGGGRYPADIDLIVERIIAVEYQRLVHGDSSQNLVIRPGDRIYVDGPPQGFIYIDGEIVRAGVYQMPASGTFTLSRLVAASGGLGPFAIPNRVDLTRTIGPLREATIRLDLAAIRQRTQPDIVLKPDDHVIIGTSFIAVPLAVIRNGFRATYGFGFLLDRNFGNDVFGPPPENFFN
jgi:protein involved in polysaccharide export with SLBB domain